MLSSIRRISVLKIWEIFIFREKQDWIQLDSMFMEMSMALGIGMREVNHETESESWQNHWWELLVNVGNSGEGGQVTEKCKCYPEESEFILDPSEKWDHRVNRHSPNWRDRWIQRIITYWSRNPGAETSVGTSSGSFYQTLLVPYSTTMTNDKAY